MICSVIPVVTCGPLAGLVALFSIVVLATGAHTLSALTAAPKDASEFISGFTSRGFDGVPDGFQVPPGVPSDIPNGLVSYPLNFAALGITVSLLTLISLIPMYVASCLRALNIY